MICLAKNKKGELERIQVVASVKPGSKPTSATYSRPLWGAYNIDGTKIIVPFTVAHLNYESVLNILLEKYDEVCLSKRRVDNGKLHIVCIDKQYYLYDEGKRIKDLGENRMVFAHPGCGEFLERQTDYPEFPDYYDQIDPVYENNQLFSAYDIDTGKWVCLSAIGNVISQSNVKEDAIHQAVRRLS